ncbi:MAG: divalent-cation tolerance protein CutA [Acidobacteriota bacterium]|nr:divalent-cation tolerance protein CutA [Acidobacteriota bacterium]
MADCWIALTTLSSREQAERLAEALVAERLAACVNVLGPVASIYRWEGRVARDEEVLLFIKTTREGVEPLQTRVLELHPYDTPEFLALEVGAGAPDYLAWVVDSVVNAGPNEPKS